jgi:anti-anti-sigma regulatory factor
MQILPCLPAGMAIFVLEMTGAAIVRWEAGGSVVMAVHGTFDGASAWALRNAMDESPARDFVIDLTHAAEAFEFAAGVIAAWARQWDRVKRVRFRPGAPEHLRLLAGYGLEIHDGDPSAFLPVGMPVPVPGSGASA